MANLNYAFCHSCGKEARGRERILNIFGYRNFQGHVYVQSHCRNCRSRESVMRRKSGLVKPHKKK